MRFKYLKKNQISNGLTVIHHINNNINEFAFRPHHVTKPNASLNSHVKYDEVRIYSKTKLNEYEGQYTILIYRYIY